MPNDDLDIHDDDDNAEDESNPVRALRQQNKKLEKEAKEAQALRRELAMLKAGINTDSKLGKLFASTYEGDLSDIAALKAEAAELGLVASEGSTATEATSSTNTANAQNANASPADTSTTERQNLATGAVPDDASGLDPRQDSLSKAEAAIKEGRSFEQAGGELVAQRVAAAMAGDKRVVQAGR